MEKFNVIAECDICKAKKVLCEEVLLITKDKMQKVETWCEGCKDKIMKEHYLEQEKLMYEVYEDIIRSSH